MPNGAEGVALEPSDQIQPSLDEFTTSHLAFMEIEIGNLSASVQPGSGPRALVTGGSLLGLASYHVIGANSGRPGSTQLHELALRALSDTRLTLHNKTVHAARYYSAWLRERLDEDLARLDRGSFLDLSAQHALDQDCGIESVDFVVSGPTEAIVLARGDVLGRFDKIIKDEDPIGLMGGVDGCAGSEYPDVSDLLQFYCRRIKPDVVGFINDPLGLIDYYVSVCEDIGRIGRQHERLALEAELEYIRRYPWAAVSPRHPMDDSYDQVRLEMWEGWGREATRLGFQAVVLRQDLRLMTLGDRPGGLNDGPLAQIDAQMPTISQQGATAHHAETLATDFEGATAHHAETPTTDFEAEGYLERLEVAEFDETEFLVQQISPVLATSEPQLIAEFWAVVTAGDLAAQKEIAARVGIDIEHADPADKCRYLLAKTALATTYQNQAEAGHDVRTYSDDRRALWQASSLLLQETQNPGTSRARIMELAQRCGISTDPHS